MRAFTAWVLPILLAHLCVSPHSLCSCLVHCLCYCCSLFDSLRSLLSQSLSHAFKSAWNILPCSPSLHALLTPTNPLYVSINVNYAGKWDVAYDSRLCLLPYCLGSPPTSFFTTYIILSKLFDFSLRLNFFICKMGGNY